VCARWEEGRRRRKGGRRWRIRKTWKCCTKETERISHMRKRMQGEKYDKAESS
jgi:hypothetical protein